MPAPTKIDPELKKRFVAAVRGGLTFTLACEHLGVTRWAIHQVRIKDPVFDKAVREAVRCALGVIEDALFAAAKGGNVTAQIFYLVNRSRHLAPDEKWENTNKVDVTARGVRPSDATSVENMTDEELHRIIAEEHEQRRLGLEGPAASEQPQVEVDPYDGVGEVLPEESGGAGDAPATPKVT